MSSEPERADKARIVNDVERWLANVVIGHNLCPFAARPFKSGQIRFALCDAHDEQALIDALQSELTRLNEQPQIETTLLIHPWVLHSFDAYNQFLNLADALLGIMQLDTEIQVASFHPHYRFDGSDESDPANYTNRSPYPLLHLLREKSVTRGVDEHPDSERIPARNVQHFRQLGLKAVRALCPRGKNAGNR